MKFVKHIIFLSLLLIVSLCSFSQNSEQDKTDKPSDDELLAAQFYQDKAYDKAAVLYEKLFNKNQNPIYYNNYLNCLFELKSFNTAEKIIRKRIKQEPQALKYRVDLGYMYLRADQKNKAEKEFESALMILNGDYQQSTELANRFLFRDMTEYAIKTYERSRTILKNKNVFNFEIAEVYDKAGEYQNMIDEYLNFIEINESALESFEHRLQIVLSNDHDNKKTDLLRKNLLKRIQQKPDITVYPELMLWFSIQQKDFQSALQQAKTLDRLYKENGSRIYSLARLCTSNKEYSMAIDAYEYIIKKGTENPFYIASNIELLQARYLNLISSLKYTKEDMADLESKYIATINQYGKNSMTINLIKTLAHIQAFYLNKYKEATDGLNQALALQQISREERAGCKMELGDILLMSGDVWEATLLYSQVEKEFKYDTLGFAAKFKNAKLFYFIGEFRWAKAQLDILKAATSKLIANDAMDLYLLINDNIDLVDSSEVPLKLYAKADLYSFQNKDDLAILSLDSIFKLFPGHNITDRALYKEAEIDLKKKNYKAADSLLVSIISKYPDGLVADDAIMTLAKYKESYCNCKEKVMELYEKLIKDYPTSIYVTEARKRFRELRGDQIN